MAATEPKRTAEQQVQEDLVRLDAYRNQLSAMLQQHSMLVNSHADHLRARETLEGLESPGGDAAALIPVGGEVFVQGSPDAAAPVLIGIGSGVLMEASRAKGSEILAERAGQIEAAVRDLEGQMRTLEGRIQALTERLERASRDGPDGPTGTPGDVGGD